MRIFRSFKDSVTPVGKIRHTESFPPHPPYPVKQRKKEKLAVESEKRWEKTNVFFKYVWVCRERLGRGVMHASIDALMTIRRVNVEHRGSSCLDRPNAQY
jgi:hypothetical protein